MRGFIVEYDVLTDVGTIEHEQGAHERFLFSGRALKRPAVGRHVEFEGVRMTVGEYQGRLIAVEVKLA